MQRLLVGELRSYSTAFEGMAMLDTVATALIAGVINSSRAYPGAKVLSLTALDHDAYPPGSGLCTMVCVVRWCGPPGVAWVATDLDLAPSRFPETDVIAEGALPDGLVVEFHRAGLLHTPRLSSEASRPLPPPPRFVVAALRPHLCATIDVASDGSISRHCMEPSNACGKCDRIWRTSVPLITPPTQMERCDLRTLTRDAVPAYVTRAIAKAIVSTLTSNKSMASAVASADALSARIRRPRQGTVGPKKHQPEQSQSSQRQPQQQQQRDAPPKETRSVCAARASAHVPPPPLLRDDDQPPKGERANIGDVNSGCDNTNARAVLPIPPADAVARSAAATSPSIVVHARCTAAGCAAVSRAGIGKIVRIECTAGCRVTFHRSCWRAMAIEPSDARPCMTPDCWGLWARVTSTRRGADGAEAPAYVEWARAAEHSPSPVKAHTRKRHTPTVTESSSSTKQHGSAASKAPMVAPFEPRSNRNGTTTTTTERDDTYVGRIRRRRLRQNQSGPPHKRMESIKALGRPLVGEAAETTKATPVVVAGGARAKSALAEQEMTRAKRRMATMPAARGSVVLDGATLLTKKARTSRPNKGPRAGEDAVATRSKRALPSEDTAVSSPPLDKVDRHEPVPVDLNGAWAAFFEWERVPPSLVPETPAARPSTSGLWTPPPLLLMAGGGAALCCPAAVWSCFCQRAMAA